jgi:hypothetical protein
MLDLFKTSIVKLRHIRVEIEMIDGALADHDRIVQVITSSVLVFLRAIRESSRSPMKSILLFHKIRFGKTVKLNRQSVSHSKPY